MSTLEKAIKERIEELIFERDRLRSEADMALKLAGRIDEEAIRLSVLVDKHATKPCAP